jgi:hypothetical protein
MAMPKEGIPAIWDNFYAEIIANEHLLCGIQGFSIRADSKLLHPSNPCQLRAFVV